MLGILQMFIKERSILFLISKIIPVLYYRLLTVSFCDIHGHFLLKGLYILNFQGIDAKYSSSQAHKIWLLNFFGYIYI